MSGPIDFEYLNAGLSGVQRTRRGRVILPDDAQLKGSSFRYFVTIGEIEELRREVRRRHFWWRVWTTVLICPFIAPLVLFIPYYVFTRFIILPLMVAHWWPFR